MIIYTVCLVAGLLFTVVSAVAGHLFGGHDGGDVGTGGHAEAGFDDSGVPGISFFSPTVLAAFITAFGACGLILRSIPATSSHWISAPLSAGGVVQFGDALVELVANGNPVQRVSRGHARWPGRFHRDTHS